VEDYPIESILVADCGTVITKLLLLEKVEASYRFVAQAETLSTNNPPWSDVSVGVVQAIAEIEAITGRTLYAHARLITPRQGLEGVDAFVVILSASKPLQIILAGLVREMSLESARRAAAGTYTSILAMLSREGGLRSPHETWARQVRDLAPDLVLLVGGVDGGATRPVMELAEAIALAATMQEQHIRPLVLYAGNASLRAVVAKLLGNITRVEVVDNVQPSGSTEHLGPAQIALEQFYIQERLMKTPGVDTLTQWSAVPFVPTAAAFARVVEYLWHRENNENCGVLGVDVGAASTTVAATFKGRSHLTIYEGGIAFGPFRRITELGLETLMRWIPEELDPEALLVFLHNRELHPWTIAQDMRELWVEQAVVREMLRGALELAYPSWNLVASAGAELTMPRFDPILISGGGIVHMPRPGQALLTVLDGVQPVGISTVYLDVNRVAPALGAVAAIKPLAAAAAMDSGALVPLGTVISPLGKARPGEVIMKMRITYQSDGGYIDVEARYGEIEIWPLLQGQKATVDIKPLRRCDVGMGPGKGGSVEVIGGLVGLVVDARGRPLEIADDPDKRRRTLNGWIWDVGGGG